MTKTSGSITKGEDRVARLKAAREKYSNLSKERSTKRPKPTEQSSSINPRREPLRPQNPPSPSRIVGFKPMASSLEMIRNNSVRIPSSGRASSFGRTKSLGPRPSLLPLGINVFDPKVSISDQMKVREFVAARLSSTGHTPKKSAPLLFAMEHHFEAPSARSSRAVRFCVDEAIQEQRESGGDEVVQRESVLHNEVKEDDPCGSGNAVPHSILKRTKTSLMPGTSSESTKSVLSEAPSAVLGSGRTPARTRLSRPSDHPTPLPRLWSASTASTASEEEPSSRPTTSGQNASGFTQAYTILLNLKEDEWRTAEPVMFDELFELMQNWKKRRAAEAALLPADSSCSLISLPDDLPKPAVRRKLGFRKVNPGSNQSSSSDLQANQEVMLINEAAKGEPSPSPIESRRTCSRLRLRDPVSKTLGGDSPFYPIRRSPFF